MLGFISMQLSVFVWQKALYSALAQSVEHAAVNRSVVGSSPTSGAIPVIMKQRIHLFPFRTQKLSSALPKVLPKVLSGPPLGRIGSCRISIKLTVFHAKNGHFSMFLPFFPTARLCFCVARILPLILFSYHSFLRFSAYFLSHK